MWYKTLALNSYPYTQFVSRIIVSEELRSRKLLEKSRAVHEHP